MNISRLDVVRAIPADDLADFAESIADAAHYLATALGSIPSDDAIEAKASELWKALEILNCYSNFADRQRKQSEETLDFSGIEKAIADEGKQMTISQMLKDQWAKYSDIDPTDSEQLATELMRG